jgi:hypothetical protein
MFLCFLLLCLSTVEIFKGMKFTAYIYAFEYINQALKYFHTCLSLVSRSTFLL